MTAKDALPNNEYWFVFYGMRRRAFFQGPLLRGEKTDISKPKSFTFYSEEDGKYYKIAASHPVADSEVGGLELWSEYCLDQHRSAEVSIQAMSIPTQPIT